MGLLARGIERLSTALAWMSMAGILLMMVLVVVDVALRTLFSSSLLLVDEVGGYLLVLAAYLAYAETLKRNSHVRVDTVFNLFSARLKRPLDLVFLALSVLAVAAVAWASVVMVYRAYVRGVTVPGVLLTPVWIPQVAMVVGLCALVLQLLVEIRKRALKS
jgi:TRAP-type C4-dicarboxylate transport system permease small subunit